MSNDIHSVVPAGNVLNEFPMDGTESVCPKCKKAVMSYQTCSESACPPRENGRRRKTMNGWEFK